MYDSNGNGVIERQVTVGTVVGVGDQRALEKMCPFEPIAGWPVRPRSEPALLVI